MAFDAGAVRSLIREIPNHPRFKGVTFYDLTTLFKDDGGFASCVDELASRAGNLGIDKVAGIEARGFALSGALAYRLGRGAILIRKNGKLPHKTISQDYELEYGTETLEMHEDAVSRGQRVAIVDDLLATGGTAKAAAKLIEELGGKVAWIGVVVELKGLKGREKLDGYDVSSLIEYG